MQSSSLSPSSTWVWFSWVWFSQGAETKKPFATPWSFCMALSQSVHWHLHFYIDAYSIFFFLGFCQCWSSADWVLTLNMNIWLSLFGSTWSRARGPDWGWLCHMCWWASEQDSKNLLLALPEITDNGYGLQYGDAGSWPTILYFLQAGSAGQVTATAGQLSELFKHTASEPGDNLRTFDTKHNVICIKDQQ